MTRVLAISFFLLTAMVSAVSQGSQSGPKPSSITGIVVREPGSEPLKKVLVQVVAENQKEGGNYTATTDVDGRFHVDNITPGRYHIFIERNGFIGVNASGLPAESNVVSVQAGQALEDLSFRMLPTCVVSGRVTDEDGDPLSEVRVAVLRRRPGKSKAESRGVSTTNDLGQYRLAGLFPGQYWIVAMPPPDPRDYDQSKAKDSSGENSSNSSDDTRPDMRYVTTYYPSGSDATQAAPVTLKAGDEMPVNFTMVPSRTYRIHGIVTGLRAGQKVFVELDPRTGDSLHSGDVDPSGQFELNGVSPGSYDLTATVGEAPQPLTARQNVTVVASDIDGLKLTPQPSFIISGRLRIEGKAPEDITRYTINLRRADSQSDTGLMMSRESFGTSAAVDGFGNFTLKNVEPGDYTVEVHGGNRQNNSFVKSVRFGEADAQTGLTATGPAALDIVVSTNGGIVEGTVMEREKDVENAHPVANAIVLAVPEQKYRNLPRHFGVGSTDQHGSFSIRGLAPGGYTIFAWQDIESEVWGDLDFLKSQEANGTPVRIEEGSYQKVELKPSPVGEEWR